jgi:hypothetical protein
MLGRLRMPLKKATDEYGKLMKNVFADDNSSPTSMSSADKSTNLEKALRSMIRDATGNEDEKMTERGERVGCKT